MAQALALARPTAIIVRRHRVCAAPEGVAHASPGRMRARSESRERSRGAGHCALSAVAMPSPCVRVGCACLVSVPVAADVRSVRGVAALLPVLGGRAVYVSRCVTYCITYVSAGRVIYLMSNLPSSRIYVTSTRAPRLAARSTGSAGFCGSRTRPLATCTSPFPGTAGSRPCTPHPCAACAGRRCS